MGSEAPLEKHSSVTVSLKGGSVHLRLSWAEGKEVGGGGEEPTAFRLLSLAMGNTWDLESET